MWKFHCCLNGSYLSTHSMKLCQNSASSLAIGKLIYNVRHIIFTHIAHGEREKRYLKTSSLQICTGHIYMLFAGWDRGPYWNDISPRSPKLPEAVDRGLGKYSAQYEPTRKR